MDSLQKIQPACDFLCQLWLRGLSKQTLRAYAYDLLVLYRFLAHKQINIDRLTSIHMTEFILYQRKQSAAPRSINRRLITLRCFLDSQYQDQAKNLFANLSSPTFYKGSKNKALLGKSYIKGKKKLPSVKVASRLIPILSPKQIQMFLSGIHKHRDRAIVYLMLFCGLRSCEVLALNLHDIDFIDDQIRVRGKGDKERLLPFAPSVRKILRYYLDYERPNCSHHSCFVSLSGPSRGQPMTASGLRKLFRTRRKQSHLHQAHAHRLRHTFCTNLISQGVSLPVAQKLMGHSDINVTMLYTHMSTHDITKEYQKAIAILEARYETP